MTIIKLCVTILLLASCRSSNEVDIELIPFNNKFERIAKECQVELYDVSLKFQSTKEKLYGWCLRYNGEVRINTKHWNKLTSVEREQLIFHELGHCRLNQNHNDVELNIMNTEGFIDEQTYTEYYNYFIRKLFIGCKAPLFKKFKYKEIK